MSGHFNTIIVGRGMMGAAAARHLATMREGVALIGPDEPLDRTIHKGVFASHYDEGRITRTIDRDPVWGQLSHRSIARYGEIAAASGIDFFTECGALIAGPSRERSRYIDALVAASHKAGAKTELLDGPALATRFPYLEFPSKIEALYERHGAGHISPRRLVAAQSMLAERQGAAVFRNTVTAIRDTGVKVTVEMDDGASVTAEQVLVATGAFTINERLLPARIDLSVFARTIAFFEVDEAEAADLAGMPSVIFRAETEGQGFYLLPPIRYPDGRFYIKIGGDPDDVRLTDEAALKAWFLTEGRTATREHLTRILCDLMPGIRVRNTLTSSCATTFSPSGYPMIGFSPSHRIAVLTAGCGAAAKSSDEIGRLGAVLMARGNLKDEGYAVDFAPAFG
ncbi:FAD-dependent oxidoreductase [Martelella alba]|uniref:FAD-dependent oxidoreductase n=1 Tax=Martelella alba TaxID=2590451 RepID=A0A506UJW0_9HYPH|nr:FAD-dependent oxidoreductase [Martelella alba]TPW33600.1 FAD-dependent oxidoreductase [Martelella alba]